MKRMLCCLLVAAWTSPAAIAENLDAAFADAAAKMDQAVAAGEVAGAAHLVFRDGEVIHLHTAGTRDVDSGKPFTEDTLLRFYSMTKPIASVAAMTLYENGKFDLDDPVSKYIPSFAEAKVLKTVGGQIERVPPKREITVRDLFRHSSGFAYDGQGNPWLEKQYARAGMLYHAPAGMMPPKMTIQAAADALAGIPLLHEPGEKYTYGFNTDVLGRLIEIWSGQSLAQYMATTVLDPLEMTDTSFQVAPEDRDRFASCHTKMDGRLVVVDPAATSPFNDGFDFVSAGGGLVSTLNDYSKFCEMLIGGGERNGKRILRRETLDLMFTDQLGDAEKPFPFGLGFSIGQFSIRESGEQRRVKKVGWGGYASTEFYVAPEEQFFQIFVRQYVPMQPALGRQCFKRVEAGMSDTPTEKERSWPGWLGAQRDGRVTDFKAPESWPPTLEQRWQAEVGTGYGSPLIDGDKVYVHARQGEEEVVQCLNLKDGSIIWKQSHATPFKMGGGGERHGKGPKSCPVLAGGRIFTLGISGVLSAYDANTGAVLWRREDALQYQPSHPYWGATTSPVVHENRVIVHLGNDKTGKLYAFDAESGEIIWSQGNDGAAYSSPLIAELGGVTQVVEWNHRAVAGVDVETGDLLWEFPFEHVGTDQNMPTPSVHDGIVYVGGENRGIRSLEPTLNDGEWSVRERWHQEDVALDMSSAVVAENALYGFSHYDSGRLFCLDLASGDVLWKGPGRTGQNATFLSFDGHVAALINNGELRILRANQEHYEVVAKYRVSDTPTWAPPVLLNEGIFAKGVDTLTFWKLPR